MLKEKGRPRIVGIDGRHKNWTTAGDGGWTAPLDEPSRESKRPLDADQRFKSAENKIFDTNYAAVADWIQSSLDKNNYSTLHSDILEARGIDADFNGGRKSSSQAAGPGIIFVGSK